MPEKILFCTLNAVAPPLVALGADSFVGTDDGARLVTTPGSTSIQDFDVSADGRYLATASPFALYDLQTGQHVPLSGWPGGTPVSGCVAFSPDGTKLAVGRSSSPYLHIFNLSAGGSLLSISSPGFNVRYVAWSPDGTKLAAASGSTSDTKSIRVYYASTWAFDSISMIGTYTAYQPAWSPDSTKLAAGFASSAPAAVRVWNASDLSEVSIAVPLSHSGNHVAWAPNGAWLAVGAVATSPNLTAYDTATWTQATIPVQGATIIRHMAWRPDSSELLVSYDSGSARIEAFDPADWSKSVPAGAPTSLAMRMIKFASTNMRRVSTGAGQIMDDAGSPASGRVVRMYDRASGALICEAATDASGQFARRYATWAPVDVRVLDDDAGTVHDDLTFSRVTPAVVP